MKRLPVILLLLCALPANCQLSTVNYQLSLDEVIADIYNAITELGEQDFEQVQADLYALHETPIDLNSATDEQLQQLYFLSPRQIDDILAYVGRHPMTSLYELRLIPSLADYEIRDLLPFVVIAESRHPENETIYPKEVFAFARHEILTRVDARNCEHFAGTDPMYVQTRYKFDFRRRVTFGAQLRRPAGGEAKDLQYGAYLQLRDFGHLHTLVAGNYQASFGQGLVLAPVFRTGKSAYATQVGQTIDGLRYYSSVDGNGLHGAGATFRWQWGRQTRLDATALYSLKRANDSTWHHLLGANLTLRHKRLQVALTAVENLWSDSIHPYRNTAYNQHYFRGRRQAVIGASVRYNHGWFDAFAEVATSQNNELSTTPHWGFGLIAGSRFYPTDGLSLLALYRYYSPYFDNQLGYAFSETSRLGDENGLYVGFELTRLRHWRLSGYADLFRFSGPKYGIPASPSLGYDALVEARRIHQSWWISLRLRARQKGDLATYSTRAQFYYTRGPLSLRTTAEANLTHAPLNYGVTIYQDLAYNFQLSTINCQLPLTLKLRVQGFDARQWANRIYCYEHDVLYAWSNTAVYGAGFRTYLCLKWQIIPQLALYARVSETVYSRAWLRTYNAAGHNQPLTKTDIHLLLRATL